MNCPHHHKIFSAEQRSYRQLPLRLAEYGTLSETKKKIARQQTVCMASKRILLKIYLVRINYPAAELRSMSSCLRIPLRSRESFEEYVL
jgi:hypothetical protein